MFKKTTLYGAILAATPLVSPMSYAQDDAGWVGLEEIVVTAQFIEQDVQDTPIAISSMTAEMMEARGQDSVQQIAGQAPNVTLTAGGAFAGPALIGFIRGVGQIDFNPALEPGVGLYVDDVYYSTLTGSIIDLLDLDRVEVLRGPQGTLAGKNSIGGAIKLYSKKPSDEKDGYVELGYGDYDEISFRGATNFTLIDDTLFARIAGVSRSREGHVTRLDFNCSHPDYQIPGLVSQIQGSSCELGTEGGIKYTAGRFALRWLPSDDVEVNFTTDILEDTSEAAANTIVYTAPSAAPVGIDTDGNPLTGFIPGPFGFEVFWPVHGCLFVPYGPNRCDSTDPTTPPDPGGPNDPYVNYSTYVDQATGAAVRPEQFVDSRGHSLNVDWQLSESLQLQSITAYRTYESGFGNDADGSPVQVQQLYQVLDHTSFSQEFRLNGSVGDAVDYTVGAFYFDAETTMKARVTLGYVGFDFIHGPDPVDSTTWAVFGNAIWHASDKVDVTVGVRYTDDEKGYTFARRNADLTTIQPCIGPPGTPGNPSNCIISSLNGTTPKPFEDTRTDYRLAVSYNWTEDFMTYAQFSTGFKGGGINPRPFYNVQALDFDPEELDAFEIGFKSKLLDNTLRINGAVFSNDYSDIQLTLTDCTQVIGTDGQPLGALGIPCLANRNAGDADVEGAELEVEWFPSANFMLDASLSVLDFEFTKIDPRTNLPANTVTPFTPEETASIGAQYTFQLGKGGSLTPRIDATYQSEVYTEANNKEHGLIDSYSLVNASITWRNAEEDVQIALEIGNVTDELYYNNITDATTTGGGTTYVSPALPRTYKLLLKHSF